jgi:hypothetical protein
VPIAYALHQFAFRIQAKVDSHPALGLDLDCTRISTQRSSTAAMH